MSSVECGGQKRILLADKFDLFFFSFKKTRLKIRPSASLLSDGSSANAFMFGIKGCENKLEINVFILGFQNPVAMKLLFSRNLWSENCYFPIWRW